MSPWSEKGQFQVSGYGLDKALDPKAVGCGGLKEGGLAKRTQSCNCLECQHVGRGQKFLETKDS